MISEVAAFSRGWLARSPAPGPLLGPQPQPVAEVERLPQLAVPCPPCTPCPALVVGASWPTWALASLVVLGFALGIGCSVCCLGGLAAAAELARRCGHRHHASPSLQSQIPRGRESLPLQW